MKTLMKRTLPDRSGSNIGAHYSSSFILNHERLQERSRSGGQELANHG